MRRSSVSRRNALVACCAIAVVATSSAAAQSRADTHQSRFDIAAVALGGPGVLVGAGASFEMLRTAALRLAIEGTLLSNLMDDAEYAPCPLPPAPCTSANKPPYITDARTVALRGEFPIGGAWRLVASAGIVSGAWRRPRGTSETPLDLGLGFARRSRSGRQSFELRAQRMETASYPTYAARVAWRFGL